jgi:tetratricopeptide (TPR) repeat protein
MKPAVVLLAASLAAAAAAAVQGPPPQEAPKLPRLTLPKGKIIDKVACAATPGQSYALYLPTAYTPDRAWPIVYALDARSDGPGIAELFRAGAELYGYIVASSNNSASDTAVDPNVAATGAMWNDTHGRFAIDARRVYAAGHSGTVRSAVRLARAAPGTIAGILGAAAGFPFERPPVPTDKFLFYGTTGYGDFNYDEVLTLEADLEKLGLPHHVDTFEGVHQWPPAELVTRALAWFDLQAMKAGTRAKEAAWIDAQWSAALALARAEEAASHLYLALRAYTAAAADFAGLHDVVPAASKAAELRALPAVQRDLAARAERSQRDRLYLRDAPGILAAVNPENGPATVGRIAGALHVAELRKKAAEASDPEERWSAKRLLAALQGQTGFYLPTLFMERKQYDRAIFVLTLASEINPKNPYPHFNRAAALAQKGDHRKALQALEQAVDLGFKDADSVEKDEQLAPLRNEEEFKKILARLRQPASAPH